MNGCVANGSNDEGTICDIVRRVFEVVCVEERGGGWV